MAEPTVSAGYAKALVGLALAKGADESRLLARARIDPGDLADPENRLPFERFKALMGAAKELCDEPALALHFGETSRMVEMSIVGLITHAAQTMAEAFAQMNRYARLVIEVRGHESGDRFAIVRRPGGVWIEDRRRDPNEFPELTESTWARFVSEYAHYFPNRPPFVKAVHVTHAAPPYRAEYDRILQAPVTFGSDRNALLIEESWLSRPIGAANRYVFGIFSERAAALLTSLENSKTVKGRVESVLIPILHTGESTMERIAKNIGLSRPTLYRQLKAEGASYERLLDDLRHKMALHYLDGKKVSVAQTAYLVGFSDPSAFSRAFRRWTGRRPGRRGEA
ncbi:MAG: AraC family transcriptional regulator [Pseudomonadota bacterium]|nr:AraC family transcriptional regulator [Pseudomonadota bacterium]